ncbi:hypothetical protein LAZ67_11003725 [Cordylochernes scorpioides]|uniref:Metalloendopeptidase n=1 Tax=Cordylochernes scorpioides TaxID=51811 RepID=A0ABY6L055_9ARAC|nr:hypothetical protein LAZ67_11003725 [Cordylochernes scorpioides]
MMPRRRPEDQDYVAFVRSEATCNSMVGHVGGRQEIKLAEPCNNPSSITHEINHAIGFFHEHERSDRDDHIKVIKKNIQPDMEDTTWRCVCAGKEDQFSKLKKDENLILDKFDLNSLMLYDSIYFSKDKENGLRTLETVDGNNIEKPPDLKLSKSDIKRINILYRCRSVE